MDIEKRFKILSAEVKFLKKDLEITEGIVQEALPEFNSHVLEKLKSTGLAPETETKVDNHDFENGQSANPPKYSDSSYEARDNDQKKLFKKIALETHPDRLNDKSQFEKDFKQDLFEKAHKAMQEDDYFSLAEIAENLNIEPPEPTKKHIDNLNSTQKRLKKKIKDLKNSYIWIWYFEENQDKKEAIVERYLNHVQGPKK